MTSQSTTEAAVVRKVSSRSCIKCIHVLRSGLNTSSGQAGLVQPITSGSKCGAIFEGDGTPRPPINHASRHELFFSFSECRGLMSLITHWMHKICVLPVGPVPSSKWGGLVQHRGRGQH